MSAAGLPMPLRSQAPQLPLDGRRVDPATWRPVAVSTADEPRR
ncbi:hypothetical protein [Pseudonocardia sp. ICBG1142]|nr:hypothetical protein [Pseudonocardia sp. ICBG1142]